MRFNNGTRGALALLDGDQTATLRDPGQTEYRAKQTAAGGPAGCGRRPDAPSVPSTRWPSISER